MVKVRKVSKGNKMSYKRRQPSKSHCSLCKKVLHGVKRGTSNGPNRKYGGELCSACSRKIIALKSKLKNKFIKKEDVPISLRKYM